MLRAGSTAPSDIAKGQGVRINLWMGLARRLLGLLMLSGCGFNPTVVARRILSRPAAARSASAED